MGELLGITGTIGSGKTTLAGLLGEYVENHAIYETNWPIIEVANRFNQLLEAELNYDTTDDDTELVNQALIWMPDIVTEHLHHETTWNQLAITPKDTRMHPELYEKLFTYLAAGRASHQLVERTITTENKTDYRALLQWIGGYFVAKISPTIWYDELFRRIELHDSRRDLIVICGVRYPSDAAVTREHGGKILRIERIFGETKQHDVTENELSKIAPDITIKNNGSLEQLQHVVEKLCDDLAAGKQKEVYKAV